MTTPPQRTTLTGRPIESHHDSLSGLLTEGSIVGGASVGANLLPPGYTDSSLVHIPIRVGDYLPISQTTASASSDVDSEMSPAYDLGNDVKREPSRKESVWSRVSKRVGGCGKSSSRAGSGSGQGSKDDGLRVVDMSRGDYLKYWAKGEDGKFRDGVVEPPGGRAEWLAGMLERQDGEKGKVGGSVAERKASRGTEGRASAVSAIGGAIGSVS